MISSALAEEIAPQADEFAVTKQYASAFFGTSLAATRTAACIDTTIIAGVTTSGCGREAVGDRDSRPHEANPFDLEGKHTLDYLENLGTK